MTWTLSAFADEAGPSTDDQIAALQKAGLKHIDLRGVDGHNISALPLDVAKAAAAKLNAAGVTVNMFGSPLGKIDISDDLQVDLDKLRHLGQLANVFNCRAVRIFSYYNKQQAPLEQWRRESLDRLARLRDLAAKLNLVLYHENERHIFGDRCDQVVEIADNLHDGKVFKLIFDFDNYNQSGDDVWSNWLKLRERNDAFHLKDSNKNNQHVPIGQGNGQAPRILADAVARGWTGPAILEPHLKHSKAIQATHVSGSESKAFVDLSAGECFAIAADAAVKLLAQVKAPWR